MLILPSVTWKAVFPKILTWKENEQFLSCSEQPFRILKRFQNHSPQVAGLKQSSGTEQQAKTPVQELGPLWQKKMKNSWRNGDQEITGTSKRRAERPTCNLSKRKMSKMHGEFWPGFICNTLYFTIISTIMIALATFAVLLWVALVFKIMPWQMAITKAAIQSQASTALWEQKFARFIHASTAPLLNFRHRFNFGPSILIMPMTSKLRTQTRWAQMYREPTTQQRHWGVSYTTVR